MTDTTSDTQISYFTTTDGVTTTTTTYLRTYINTTYQTLIDASGQVWKVEHSLVGGFDEIS